MVFLSSVTFSSFPGELSSAERWAKKQMVSIFVRIASTIKPRRPRDKNVKSPVVHVSEMVPLTFSGISVWGGGGGGFFNGFIYSVTASSIRVRGVGVGGFLNASILFAVQGKSAGCLQGVAW